MVSKLALAIGEALATAARVGAEPELFARLYEHYRQVREGLGMNKTPAHYGAFPVDPYSHTPGFAGVQQPGMTGQVKEDIINRFLELGVSVEDGTVVFAPCMLARDEFLSEPATWSDHVGGVERREPLEAGSLAFSLCGVPVVYRASRSAAVRVFHGESEPAHIPGASLGQVWSRKLFERDGGIRRIEVDVPEAALR
jgi:hypothetical protein